MFLFSYYVGLDVHLRCYLRERALLVRARVMFKNKTAGLLIERGVLYETKKLHRKRYLAALLEEHATLLEDLKPLLAFNRMQIERLEQMDNVVVRQLVRNPLPKERIERLKSIDGVGDLTALTWAVEVGNRAASRMNGMPSATADCVRPSGNRRGYKNVDRYPSSATASYKPH